MHKNTHVYMYSIYVYVSGILSYSIYRYIRSVRLRPTLYRHCSKWPAALSAATGGPAAVPAAVQAAAAASHELG